MLFCRLKSNNYLKAFLLSFLLGTIIVLPSIISGKGFLTVIDDFNYQQIPFNILTNNLIKEGNLLWNWYTDIGSSFIGSFSFYNIGSPFFWFTLIFPASWFPYLIGPMLILKYAVAGLTSFAFLQRYTKNKNYALIGSLLYAFSGFQLTNMLFNHFHDVVALFPLLLLGLDKLVYDNKKGWFAFSVAILALTNYFFFIGQVVFVIIYFIVKVVTKEYKINLRKFIQIFLEALIGVGISAFLLLPSLVFVVGNPRIDGSWNLVSMFLYNFGRYADIFRALIMPSEVMSYRSMGFSFNYRSVEAYLPFVGSILFLTYLWKRPRNWISVLMIVSLIFMFVPILNSAFFAFTIPYYARWFYMPILIFALASIKTMEENLKIKSGLIIMTVIFVLLTIGAFLYSLSGAKFIFQVNYFLLVIIFFVLNAVCLGIIFQLKNADKLFVRLILFGIVIYTSVFGNIFFYQNKKSLKNDEYYIESYFGAKDIKIDIKDGERFDTTLGCFDNIGNLIKKPVITGWNSTINGSVFDFYNSIGFERKLRTYFNRDDFDLRNFLSVKYIISCYSFDNQYFQHYYDLIYSDEIYNIYENKNYLHMGIIYDYYISANNFNLLSNDEKKKMLLQAVVLSEKQITQYKHLFLGEISNDEIQVNNMAEYFKITRTGFISVVNSDKDSLILYTVPNDAGWSAKVNGQKVNIELVNAGLMAIKINEGINNIEFIYFPVELKFGIILSVVSFLSLGLYLKFYKLKEDY